MVQRLGVQGPEALSGHAVHEELRFFVQRLHLDYFWTQTKGRSMR